MASLTYGSVIGGGPGYTTVNTPQGPRTIVGDRAVRNNNPGNIEAGSYANSYGAIGTDGRFAVFGSRLTGTRAQAGLIFGKNYANLTLRQAIAKYAPSFENNTAAYAAAVAAAAGVSLDTKMKDIPANKQAAVVAGMQAVEGNTQANVYDGQGNLVGTIDPTSPRTPNTAPTPYSADSQQADTTPGAPIGHVSRSPLGPAAPAMGTPSFSGMATPRGIGSITPAKAAPPTPSFSGLATPRGMANAALSGVAPAVSRPSISPASTMNMKAAAPQSAPAAPSGSFTSQDEKSNTGSYTNAQPSGNFVSQDERASLAERMGMDPATGITAPALGPVAPTVAAAAVPARPAIAAVPAAVPNVAVPAVARIAPAVPSYSPSQAMAPARPSLSAADVYGGAIGTAQTTTPGTTVSRVSASGPTYTTNKFGAVTATAPDGTQMAAWGGVPSPSAIAGPLSQPGIAAPSTGVSGMFGPKAKAATGTLAGAAIGGYALGPLGAVLGGLIGKNLAQGKTPFSGIFGTSGNAIGTHIVDTFDGPMSFANAQGGLGFPSAPANPGGFTATSSNNSAAGMRGISPGAASAISHGTGGLY